MSEDKNPEHQATAQADGDSDLSDESLEAVSGGLTRYVSPPGGLTPPTMPVIKPIWEPSPTNPIIIVNE
ncbi:MAG TPA: hypothetical protein VFR81_23145 [Longimicrobium sp.]|nr:hypothetical protein [Longimicrobium sp.]